MRYKYKKEFSKVLNKRPRRKQRGIVTLFLTFHTPQGAGNLPVILLNEIIKMDIGSQKNGLYSTSLLYFP